MQEIKRPELQLQCITTPNAVLPSCLHDLKSGENEPTVKVRNDFESWISAIE